MATKKGAAKKAVAKSAKGAKPAAKASKSPAKKAAPVKKSKPAPKKAVAKKAVAKKPAPVKKAALKKAKPAPKKAAPKKAVKPSKPIAKKLISKKPMPVAKKKVAPAKKAPEPVKKKPTQVPEPAKKAAPASKSQLEVKAAPPKPAKKEPAKPVVIPKTSTTKKVKYEPEFTKSVLDAKQRSQNEGPSMRYSDADLNEFRDLINKKLDTAKKELNYLQGLITRKDESGDMEDGRYMTMEDGSMSMEREQLSQMASRQIQFIDHLEKAIMRIENKTYGICRVTGKLIDKARLRAVPHATLSIEAKHLMNK